MGGSLLLPCGTQGAVVSAGRRSVFGPGEARKEPVQPHQGFSLRRGPHGRACGRALTTAAQSCPPQSPAPGLVGGWGKAAREGFWSILLLPEPWWLVRAVSTGTAFSAAMTCATSGLLRCRLCFAPNSASSSFSCFQKMLCWKLRRSTTFRKSTGEQIRARCERAVLPRGGKAGKLCQPLGKGGLVLVTRCDSRSRLGTHPKAQLLGDSGGGWLFPHPVGCSPRRLGSRAGRKRR